MGVHQELLVSALHTALLRPDVSGIPSGATVISAILYLYNKNASQTGTNTISVHRMLKEWGEGTGGNPANAGGATWLHAKYDTVAWATAGAKGASDRAATATFSLGKNLADPDGWISGLEVDADVQAWVGGTAPNYGWALFGTANPAYSLFSSSDAEGDFEPYLEVEYSTGGDSTDIIISPDPPVVTVTPVGGAERALRLEGHPSYSVARGIGYEAASIPVAFEDMSAPDLQGAEVHIHGTGWRGVIVKRPVPGKPLIVMGKGVWVGSLKRTSALYADNRLRQWREWQDAAVGSGAIRPAITPSAVAWWIGLTKGEQPYTVDEWSDATNRGSGITPPVVTTAGVWLGLTNGVQAVGACGMQFFDPANGVNRIQATWSKAANTNFGLIVYRGTAEGVVSATPYSNTGTGATIDLALPAGTVWAAICLVVPSAWTPTSAGLGILISSLWVNSTPVYYRRAGIDYYDERGITNLRFAWVKPATTSYGVMVLRGDSEGVIAGTPLTLQNSTGGTVDLPMPPGTKWVAIALATNAWRVPNLAAQGIAISGIVVNGRGLTTVDTQAVADDIIDSDIDSPYGLTPVAAYPFIQHTAQPLMPLMFDATDMNTKFATLMERAPIEYGWYEGRHWDVATFPVDAFPHVWDRPTAPAYLLPLHSCEELPQLELSSLDEMTSGTYVHYERPDGSTTTWDGPDQDETHPLVALGIKRYGEITAQVDDDTAAGMVAWTANVENGRQRVRGSVTVRTLLTIDGAVADRTAIRGGDIVRLTGSEAGAIDVRLLRATFEGELMTLEFDGGDYSLDALLANLSARAG